MVSMTCFIEESKKCQANKIYFFHERNKTLKPAQHSLIYYLGRMDGLKFLFLQ